MKLKQAPGNIILRTVKEIWYWLVYIFSSYIGFKEMLQRKNKLKELPKRDGEVAVITGGVRGFGFEVVKQLLQCGFTVFVGDVDSGEDTKKKIKAAGLPAENVEYLLLNLKSFKSVRNFAATVLKKASRIDLLFNNAGIMFSPYEQTEDGFESQFQVNYLGHFLLTHILLPKIKETSLKKELCCRIVNTSSIAAYCGFLNGKQIGLGDEVYACNKAYSDSKLALVLHATYLDRQLAKENVRVRSYSIHPGVVPSRLWENVWAPMRVVLLIFNKFYRTTEDGANGIIYAALAPELENKGGIFLNNCQVENPNAQTDDFGVQNILWEKSIRLTNFGS